MLLTDELDLEAIKRKYEPVVSSLEEKEKKSKRKWPKGLEIISLRESQLILRLVARIETLEADQEKYKAAYSILTGVPND